MCSEKLIRGYVDEEGYARAEALSQDDIRAESLAYVLEAGMQGNAPSAQEALDKLAAFERGERDEISFGGNDIGIEVKDDEGKFVDLYCPKERHPNCRYTIDELRDALMDWRDMIVSSVKWPW